ncbi:MAG: D-alanine--D-alanine ligase [Sedimentisphaerales bacterium]|nr:D-alanine--D-alanine ligase [Sedimentisphaerales bacterium]
MPKLPRVSGNIAVKVLVLRGGPGCERQVSLASGGCVAAALRQAGHRVTEADINPDDLSALDEKKSGHFDIVFPMIHGTFGEDGQLQEIMEQRGVQFVGSNSKSSRLAMDKFQSKKAFTKAGLLTPKAELLERSKLRMACCGNSDECFGAVLDELSLPCVIKPNAQGSSVGVVIAAQREQAISAVRDALTEYGNCLVEEFIDGREFTVGIVGGQVLPVLEVRPAERFYDYRAKYLADDTGYIFDSGLSGEELDNIQEIALCAFLSLGCRDLARVDMIRDTAGRVYVLEVNTLPGFTDHSLVPKAAARVGMSMEKLCDQIVQMALKRPICKSSC